MRKSKKIEEFCLIQHGLNGEATFSLIYNQGKKPIITNKSVVDVTAHIIRAFPAVAERIAVASDSLSETGDINLSKIDPSYKERFINSISIGFKSKQKSKV